MFSKTGEAAIRISSLESPVGELQNGLQAATEQTVRDLIFADEILAGGGWLVDKTTDFLKPLGHEACCRRNGLDGLIDDEE